MRIIRQSQGRVVCVVMEVGVEYGGDRGESSVGRGGRLGDTAVKVAFNLGVEGRVGFTRSSRRDRDVQAEKRVMQGCRSVGRPRTPLQR